MRKLTAVLIISTCNLPLANNPKFHNFLHKILILHTRNIISVSYTQNHIRMNLRMCSLGTRNMSFIWCWRGYLTHRPCENTARLLYWVSCTLTFRNLQIKRILCICARLQTLEWPQHVFAQKTSVPSCVVYVLKNRKRSSLIQFYRSRDDMVFKCILAG
jgi:hypothetical protein